MIRRDPTINKMLKHDMIVLGNLFFLLLCCRTKNYVATLRGKFYFWPTHLVTGRKKDLAVAMSRDVAGDNIGDPKRWPLPLALLIEETSTSETENGSSLLKAFLAAVGDAKGLSGKLCSTLLHHPILVSWLLSTPGRICLVKCNKELTIASTNWKTIARFCNDDGF